MGFWILMLYLKGEPIAALGNFASMGDCINAAEGIHDDSHDRWVCNLARPIGKPPAPKDAEIVVP